MWVVFSGIIFCLADVFFQTYYTGATGEFYPTFFSEPVRIILAQRARNHALLKIIIIINKPITFRRLSLLMSTNIDVVLCTKNY